MPTDVKPILVIGSLNMDLIVRCDRLPQAGQTIAGRELFVAPGGKGANQAVAAGKLGARVSMAGCVGRDTFGEALKSSLRDAGVRADDVMTVDQPTGTALITVDAVGANTIVVVPGANGCCDAALIDRALARTDRPGILLLQHEIPVEANARAIHAARKAGWFVMLNPAPARPVAPELLKLVDLVVPNETEAGAISGHSIGDSTDAFAAARTVQAMGARAIVVTLGGEGSILCDASGAWRCPAVPVEAVDTTAAGDAYIGALAVALAEGRELMYSMSFAAAAAALAVTRLGAQPSLPSRVELARFIEQRGVPVVQRWSPAPLDPLDAVH